MYINSSIYTLPQKRCNFSFCISFDYECTSYLDDISVRCPNLTCPYQATTWTSLDLDHLYWKCKDGSTCVHELMILNGKCIMYFLVRPLVHGLFEKCFRAGLIQVLKVDPQNLVQFFHPPVGTFSFSSLLLHSKKKLFEAGRDWPNRY